MTLSARIAIWDGPTRLFHWMLVGLLGFSWWSAETHHMDWHQYSGLIVCGLLAFRLIWGLIGSSTARFANFVRGPQGIWSYVRGAGAAVGHNPVGALSVIALLLVLVVQVGTGVFAVDVDGLESGPLSYLVEFDQGRQAAQIHAIAFNVLLGLAGLHVLAILFYLVIKRHNLVGPMITGSGPAPVKGDGIGLVRAPVWRLVVGIVVAALFAYAVARGFR